MIRVSVPGKLMLAGEYVVVERGTPALAVAVDRRMIVEVEADPAAPPDKGWRITSESVGLTDAPISQSPFVAEAFARVPTAPKAGKLVVKTQLGMGSEKPGLGTSAALCVAAYAAFHRLAGHRGPPDLGPIIGAHRAAQGGRGSGYDVAACLVGGVTVFTPGLGAENPKVERIGWPKGLHAAVFKARRGSSTAGMLTRVAAWREEDPDTLDACLDPLAAETEELIAAFRAGDVERILTACAQVQEELGVMDRLGDVGILSGGTLQLGGIIEDSGCVARTAGAGGGDSVWALSEDPQALERATLGARELGFERLDIQFPGTGLHVGDEA